MPLLKFNKGIFHYISYFVFINTESFSNCRCKLCRLSHTDGSNNVAVNFNHLSAELKILIVSQLLGFGITGSAFSLRDSGIMQNNRSCTNSGNN